MIYFTIALFAATIGTLVGVGGGLIMRPLLNLVDVAKGLASFTSAITVLSMAMTNLIVAKTQGKKIEFNNIVFLGIGGIIGAFIGANLMAYSSENFINIAYLGAIIIIFISVVIREKVDVKPVKNSMFKILLGVICGTLSSFFGIGGGPFLMTVLLVFLGLKPKEAALQSILITLVTTSSSMIQYSISGYADFTLAIYCVPAGIIGGILGRKISSGLNHSTVKYMFYSVLIVIMMVQLYTVLLR